MSDLSQPAVSALATPDAKRADLAPRFGVDAAGELVGFVWPTPDGFLKLAESGPLQCRVEGLNGQALQGELVGFDTRQQQIHLRLPSQRRPQPLRMNQFRRLEVLAPLPLQAAPADARDLDCEPAGVPFQIEFEARLPWAGRTLGHRLEDCGLFLFVPVDAAADAVRRWFVPRSAYRSAELGPRIGEALVEAHSATPEQLRSALAEQDALRNRRLGEMMVVQQIITADELAEAIDRQSRMPMVRIGEALAALGFITPEQLEEALQQQRLDRGVPLGELMVRSGMVTRADLQTALARKMGYPLVDVLKFAPDAEAVGRLPYGVAARLPALPLMMRGGRLVTALEDPTDHAKVDEIEFAAQCKIVPVLARSGALRGAIDHAYEKVGAIGFGQRIGGDPGAPIDFEPGDASKLLATMERGDAQVAVDDNLSIEQSDNSLVRLINSMIVEAHDQGVSDIHIECPPGREKVRIRFRRDGRLRPYLELPPSYRNALIARLKIMCDLDISEKRKPQDGKIAFSRFVQGMKLELRVATVPTHGNLEDAVLRLLQSSRPIPLADLGLSASNLRELTAAAARPHGMLLCVGPTGSGKTTTLHSVLARINQPERKIWTAEDPIEITQPGLRQVQVNARIDWTFAKAMRAFLRADPDVIMVGEIRDAETARVAIEASLTGHLVLSTLHTNSAPETVTRLLDMGMDPFNFADALLGVLAQRLVRRLCLKCRVQRDASADETDELLHDHLHVMAGSDPVPAADDVLADWRARFGVGGRLQHWHSPGCEHCGQDGHRGRAGIHELMMVSRPLRQMIQNGSNAEALQRRALDGGMRTLRQDGIEKVLSGVTTIEEVRASS